MDQDTLQKLFDEHLKLISEQQLVLTYLQGVARVQALCIDALEKRVKAVEDKQRSAPSWQDLRQT